MRYAGRHGVPAAAALGPATPCHLGGVRPPRTTREEVSGPPAAGAHRSRYSRGAPPASGGCSYTTSTAAGHPPGSSRAARSSVGGEGRQVLPAEGRGTGSSTGRAGPPLLASLPSKAPPPPRPSVGGSAPVSRSRIGIGRCVFTLAKHWPLLAAAER